MCPSKQKKWILHEKSLAVNSFLVDDILDTVWWGPEVRVKFLRLHFFGLKRKYWTSVLCYHFIYKKGALDILIVRVLFAHCSRIVRALFAHCSRILRA